MRIRKDHTVQWASQVNKTLFSSARGLHGQTKREMRNKKKEISHTRGGAPRQRAGAHIQPCHNNNKAHILTVFG